MGKEDNLKKWKKGESGNPKGREKGSKNRSTIARKWLETMQANTKNPLTEELEDLTIEDLITLAQIKKAKESGDTNAYKALMDSAFGAPTQPIEQTNIDKTPPKIEWTDTDNETE